MKIQTTKRIYHIDSLEIMNLWRQGNNNREGYAVGRKDSSNEGYGGSTENNYGEGYGSSVENSYGENYSSSVKNITPSEAARYEGYIKQGDLGPEQNIVATYLEDVIVICDVNGPWAVNITDALNKLY